MSMLLRKMTVKGITHRAEPHGKPYQPLLKIKVSL